MSQRPPSSKSSRKPPVAERRADPESKAAQGSLRHLKSLLGRPIGFERRDGHLHVVLVDRRRKPRPAAAGPTPAELCAELREHLLAHRADNVTIVMRHVVLVHDELRRRGWAGVAALPAAVLARAQVQAEMLAGEEASPTLAALVDKLRQLHTAAELREQRTASEKTSIEVSETTQDAFDEAERSWVGTIPPVVPRG